MELVSVSEDSSGLQIAWLLGTIGSKLNTKKSIKQDILEVSIPQVCEELISVSTRKNIRYTSNILYGIALLYNSKINYFLNEVSFIKAQLNRDLLSLAANNGRYNNANLNSQIVSKVGQIFLENDPEFNIVADLVPQIDFLEEMENSINSHKRRKLDIMFLDNTNFPTDNSTVFIHGISNVTSTTTKLFDTATHDDVVNEFLDQSFAIGNETTASSHIPHEELGIEFDFDFDGPDLEGNKHSNQLIDFEIEGLRDDIVENTEEAVIYDNISNDTNFKLSGISNPKEPLKHHILGESSTSQKRKREYQFLLVDLQEKLTISEDELRAEEIRYDNTISRRISDHITSNTELRLIEILDGLYIRSSPFSNLVKNLVHPTLYNWNDQAESITQNLTSIHSMIRELNVSRRVNKLNDPEFEVGRDIIPADFDIFRAEDPTEINFSGEEPDDRTLVSNDVFNLSFGSLESYDGKSGPSTKGNQRSADSSEEDDKTHFNKLVRFFDLITTRSEAIGVKYVSNALSLEDFEENTEMGVSSSSREYYSIRFSQLIPNISASDQMPISKNLAANSFHSVLSLATRNIIAIIADPPTDNEITPAHSIQIISKMQ
ncbi:sporulation protein [Scheffersomyces xylosifermentans]|uniref:sporulation protein n=1 Tax=Scheffersomyces xylosifermentans TaxID=1304137 RepID=UPI00315CBA48